MTDISRRKVLSAGVAAGVSGLAGCLDSLVEGEENTEDDQSSDDGTPSTSDGIQVTNVETETVDTACRSDEEEGSESTINGDTVEVTGTLFTSNPCHTVSAEASVSGSTLSVAVSGEPEEGTECTQCLGRVEYQVQVSLSEAGVETVDVSHGSGDGTGEGASSGSSDGQSADTMDADTSTDIELAVETIESGQGTCAQGDEYASGNREDGTLTLDGVIQAPNPCHEAVVSDITTSGGTQTVNVGVESTLGEDEMCQQCLGHISYQVTLSGANTASNEEIRVQHSSGFSTTI
jgi:hypothetical protein